MECWNEAFTLIPITPTLHHSIRKPLPPEYIAEVIESSTTEFTAQTRELHESPPFGSFIKVGSPLTVIAMIYHISTGSTDLNRRPIAYGKTEDELRNEQPQIFELLRTEMKAKIVGYYHDEGSPGDLGMRQQLPPQPPRLHHFVYACTPEEIREFTGSFDYLRPLAGIGGTLSDELLIAAVQQTCQAHQDTSRETLVRVGKEMARLLRDDYDRLESVLRRIAL